MQNSVLYLIYGALVIILLGSLDKQNPDIAIGLGVIFLVPAILAVVTGKTFASTGVVHWKKEPGLFWSALAIWITLAFVCFYIGITL